MHKEDIKKECKNRNLFLAKFLGGMGLQYRPIKKIKITPFQREYAHLKIHHLKEQMKQPENKGCRIFYNNMMCPDRTYYIKELGEAKVETKQIGDRLEVERVGFGNSVNDFPERVAESSSYHQRTQLTTTNSTDCMLESSIESDLEDFKGLTKSGYFKRDPSIRERLRKKYTDVRLLNIRSFSVGNMILDGQNPEGYCSSSQETTCLSVSDDISDAYHIGIVPPVSEEAHIGQEIHGGLFYYNNNTEWLTAELQLHNARLEFVEEETLEGEVDRLPLEYLSEQDMHVASTQDEVAHKCSKAICLDT
jgi:hypothetical protein